MKDGGPAFPQAYDFEKDMPMTSPAGLTKREWFAGMALMGLLAGGVDMDMGSFHAFCYKHADAMIAEGSKP